jgi:hypothetical protein
MSESAINGLCGVVWVGVVAVPSTEPSLDVPVEPEPPVDDENEGPESYAELPFEPELGTLGYLGSRVGVLGGGA